MMKIVKSLNKKCRVISSCLLESLRTSQEIDIISLAFFGFVLKKNSDYHKKIKGAELTLKLINLLTIK